MGNKVRANDWTCLLSSGWKAFDVSNLSEWLFDPYNIIKVTRKYLWTTVPPLFCQESIRILLCFTYTSLQFYGSYNFFSLHSKPKFGLH